MSAVTVSAACSVRAGGARGAHLLARAVGISSQLHVYFYIGSETGCPKNKQQKGYERGWGPVPHLLLA